MVNALSTNLGSEYSPQISNPSGWDKFSAFFGDNSGLENVAQRNQYEYNKAYQLNKDLWNVQGKVRAGINPLISYSQSADGGSNSYSSQKSNYKMMGVKELFDIIGNVVGIISKFI